jgi:hypothetical protein
MSMGQQKPSYLRTYLSTRDALVALEYAILQCRDDPLKGLQRSYFHLVSSKVTILRQAGKEKPPEGGFLMQS